MKIAFLIQFLASVAIARDNLFIILFDGLRWDYVDRMTKEEVPNFKKFLFNGATVEYVQPVFPAEKYPSWTTIVSGLYPEYHGIIGDFMFDPSDGTCFDISSDNCDDPKWWKNHIPLWITATRAGIKTSLYQWSRCDVLFNNTYPEKCSAYDPERTENATQLLDNLMDGIADLKHGFGLVFVYYSNLGQVGYEFGPDTTEMLQEMTDIDSALGTFMDQIAKEDLMENTNLVLLSDHGVTNSKSKTYSSLKKFTNPNLLEKVVDRGAFTNIFLKDKKQIDAVIANLSLWEGIDVYRASEIPEHFGIRKSPHILDILAVSKGTELIDGDIFHQSHYIPKNMEKRQGLYGFDDTSPQIGDYLPGYYPDMRAFFAGHGPGFKKGFLNKWIKLVDEYQIFTYLLDIEARPHNGTWSRISPMMNSAHSTNDSKITVNLIIIIGLVLLLAKIQQQT